MYVFKSIKRVKVPPLGMQEKSQNILLVIIVVLLIVLGVSIFFQQRAISELRGAVMPSAAPGQNASLPVGSKLSDQQVAETTSLLVDNTREITGKITELADNSMKIEAEIVDLAKISEAPAVDQLPKVAKTYRVSVNDKTEFPNFKIKDFRAGQTARVFSDELVYKTDNLTAAKIIPFAEPAQNSATAGNQPKIVSGRVEKIEANALTMKSLESAADQKEYTVNVSDKTKFLKINVTPAGSSNKNFKQEQVEIKLADIKQGDAVNVLPTQNAGDNTKFEAASVTVIPLPPAS